MLNPGFIAVVLTANAINTLWLALTTRRDDSLRKPYDEAFEMEL